MLGDGMDKKIKKFVLYTSSLVVLSAGIKTKLCLDKSKEFDQEVKTYTNEFIQDDYLIAAHRGYSSLEIENTMSSVTLADECPYIDYIEIDIRLTKDNELILSHDDTLLSKDKEFVNVSEQTLKDLKENEYLYYSITLKEFLSNIFDDEKLLDNRVSVLNKKEYNISSLKEVLFYADKKPLLLDLKFDDNREKLCEALLKELEGVDNPNIIIQSDDVPALLYLKDLAPNYKYSAIVKNEKEMEYASHIVDNLCVKKSIVTKENVEDAYNNVDNIFVWTINDPYEIDKLRNKIGPNADKVVYVTDYPDVVATYLNKTKIKK